MPNGSMPVKANSIDSGIARATISRRPQVAQEGEQHGDDQQPAFEQVLAHGVDDVVHQLGAVVDRRDFDVGRQRALSDSSSLSFMAQVTSWLFSPISMKPRPSTTSPLPSAVTAPRRISWPISTSATSADADRHAVLGRDDDLADLRRRWSCGPALGPAACRCSGVMLPPPTLRLFFSTASTTSSNVRPCLISRCGIDADLVLLLVAAPAVDLRRARHGAHGRLDHPVVNRAQVGDVGALRRSRRSETLRPARWRPAPSSAARSPAAARPCASRSLINCRAK